MDDWQVASGLVGSLQVKKVYWFSELVCVPLYVALISCIWLGETITLQRVDIDTKIVSSLAYHCC